MLIRSTVIFSCVTKLRGRDKCRAPQPLPFGGVFDHTKDGNADRDQTYRQKQGKQGIAGHKRPDLAGKVDQIVHAAHDGLHAGGDSRLR